MNHARVCKRPTPNPPLPLPALRFRHQAASPDFTKSVKLPKRVMATASFRIDSPRTSASEGLGCMKKPAPLDTRLGRHLWSSLKG